MTHSRGISRTESYVSRVQARSRKAWKEGSWKLNVTTVAPRSRMLCHWIVRAWLRRLCLGLGNGKGSAQRQRKIYDTKTLSSATKHENKAKQNKVKWTKSEQNRAREKFAQRKRKWDGESSASIWKPKRQRRKVIVSQSAHGKTSASHKLVPN